MSFFMKLVTLAGVPSAIAVLFGIPVWLMRRKVEDSVTAYEALEARLKTALKEAARLGAPSYPAAPCAIPPCGVVKRRRS